MNLLDKIEKINDSLHTTPLSQILQLLMPISLECQDYDGYSIMYYWNMTFINGSRYNVSKDLAKILLSANISLENIKTISNKALEISLDMREAEKDNVYPYSIVEMENMIKQYETTISLLETPTGLNPTELYYISEKNKSEKIQLIKHIQLIEKCLSNLRIFITGRLTIYRQKALETNSYYSDDIYKKIDRVLYRFKIIANQLSHRHDNRNTITIKDEYDVQDLLHALLKVDFDDIRPEEWTPSYAGGAVRMDFLLKEFDTVIEVKMTRNSMTSKTLGEELIVDIEKYQCHPDCKKLYCFVYDPEMRLGNPIGLKKDLESKHKDFLHVIITQ